MARQQIGSTVKITSTGNATTGKSGTATPPAGSRRAGLFLFSRGYVNDIAAVFPASFPMGGQTVSALTPEKYSLSPGYNSSSRLYVVGESTIAAMSDGDFAMTYVEELAAAYEISVMVLWYQDVDQTHLGTIFGHLDSNDFYASVRGAELATAAGDLLLCFGDQRASNTANSLYTGMTALDTLAASAGDDDKSTQRVDYIVASGTPTTAAMTFGDTETGGAHVVSLREDLGGGGGLSIPVAMHLRRTMGMS